MVPQELDQFTGGIYRLPCCAFRTSPTRRALRPLKSTPTFQALRESQSLESFGSRPPRNSRIASVTLITYIKILKSLLRKDQDILCNQYVSRSCHHYAMKAHTTINTSWHKFRTKLLAQVVIRKTTSSTLIIQIFIHKYQPRDHPLAKSNQILCWKTWCTDYLRN